MFGPVWLSPIIILQQPMSHIAAGCAAGFGFCDNSRVANAAIATTPTMPSATNVLIAISFRQKIRCRLREESGTGQRDSLWSEIRHLVVGPHPAGPQPPGPQPPARGRHKRLNEFRFGNVPGNGTHPTSFERGQNPWPRHLGRQQTIITSPRLQREEADLVSLRPDPLCRALHGRRRRIAGGSILPRDVYKDGVIRHS